MVATESLSKMVFLNRASTLLVGHPSCALAWFAVHFVSLMEIQMKKREDLPPFPLPLPHGPPHTPRWQFSMRGALGGGSCRPADPNNVRK